MDRGSGEAAGGFGDRILPDGGHGLPAPWCFLDCRGGALLMYALYALNSARTNATQRTGETTMSSRRKSGLAVLFTLSIAVYGGTAAAQGPHAACNRACLIDLAKSYVAAVAAHDVSAAPLAATSRSSRTSRA